MTTNIMQVTINNNTYMVLLFKLGCAVSCLHALVKELSNKQLNLNIFNAYKQLILGQTASTEDQRDIERTPNVLLDLFRRGDFYIYCH